MTAKPRVGVVGLGAMGGRMAERLVDAGFDVVVHNRTRERESELVRRGATPAASPREVAATADVVVGCLLDDDAVWQVYLGAEGMIGTARQGQVFIEHATFSPSLAREVEAALAGCGATFLDAPVSGGPEGALNGTLTAMVGGRDQCATATEVMRAYSSRVVHVGPAGAGLELKLVNQLLVSCHAAAAAEAEELLSRMEIPLDVAATVLNVSWASSAMLSRMFDRRHAGADAPSQATVGGLEAPQRLVRELLASHDLAPVVSSAALDVFASARALGRGRHDLTELLVAP